jgi:hypothetical protein
MHTIRKIIVLTLALLATLASAALIVSPVAFAHSAAHVRRLETAGAHGMRPPARA